MKVLAFAASNSRRSINRQLLEYAVSLLGGVDVELLDINDYEMPLYSIDREEADGIPERARAFYRKIGEADALVISFAEHNGTYTAAFKNLFDWTSRFERKLYQGKPAIMLSTSPGPGGGKNVLATATSAAPHFDAQLIGSLSVPAFQDSFVAGEGIQDAELQARLEEIMALLGSPAPA